MKNKKGIGFSPLTERVLLGTQNKEKGMWTGVKEDITQDFLHCMFQYLPINTSRTIDTGEDQSVFIHVPLTEEGLNKASSAIEKLKITLSSQ